LLKIRCTHVHIPTELKSLPASGPGFVPSQLLPVIGLRLGLLDSCSCDDDLGRGLSLLLGNAGTDVALFLLALVLHLEPFLDLSHAHENLPGCDKFLLAIGSAVQASLSLADVYLLVITDGSLSLTRLSQGSGLVVFVEVLEMWFPSDELLGSIVNPTKIRDGLVDRFHHAEKARIANAISPVEANGSVAVIVEDELSVQEVLVFQLRKLSHGCVRKSNPQALHFEGEVQVGIVSGARGGIYGPEELFLCVHHGTYGPLQRALDFCGDKDRLGASRCVFLDQDCHLFHVDDRNTRLPKIFVQTAI
jgi:hypothetical protein